MNAFKPHVAGERYCNSSQLKCSLQKNKLVLFFLYQNPLTDAEQTSDLNAFALPYKCGFQDDESKKWGRKVCSLEKVTPFFIEL